MDLNIEILLEIVKAIAIMIAILSLACFIMYIILRLTMSDEEAKAAGINLGRLDHEE